MAELKIERRDLLIAPTFTPNTDKWKMPVNYKKQLIGL